VDSHACLDVGPVEIDLSIEYTPTRRDRELLGEFNPSELGIHSRRAAACCVLTASCSVDADEIDGVRARTVVQF
jgi:hypothetical protein